jgi:hypothetical protein
MPGKLLARLKGTSSDSLGRLPTSPWKATRADAAEEQARTLLREAKSEGRLAASEFSGRLSQKKDKPTECEPAAEQDGPVPFIKAKKSALRPRLGRTVT